jgi:hypothetical protein
MNQLIDEIAFDYDIDVKSIGGIDWWIKKEKEKLMEQLRSMANVGQEQLWQPPEWMAPPWMPQEEAPQEEWVRKKIGGVMSPATPSLEKINPMM